MWSYRTEELNRGRVQKFALERDPSVVSYADVLNLWQHDADFRAFFISLLAGSPFSAFRWETPAITTATATRPFEFVLLDDPDLARTPEPEAFAEHFNKTPVVSFPNLRGDAILVVPCPLASTSAYGHLAAFVRHAPEPQQHALWQAVGKSASQRIGKKPVWISTAGAGVSWLHVRLDDRPKYYGHDPYRVPG